MTAGRTGWTLFLGALGVRLAALGLAAGTGRFPEFWEYEYLARNLLAGRGFVYFHMGIDYRGYVEPLYPFLVAGVYAVTRHGVLALGLVQCLLSALVPLVVYGIGRRTFGHGPGAAAGLLIAIHPGLAAYATKFHPLVLDSLFLALVALATLRLAQAPGPGNACRFGAALGACVLTRPTVLAVVPPAIGWLAWRHGPARALARCAAGLAVAAVTVGPWVLRNHAALGAFVLTRTNTGYVFWLGNHPGATGGAGAPSGVGSQFDAAPAGLKQRILAAGELEQNQIFLAEALRYVRQRPLAFAGRTVRKLYYFWWFAPYEGRGYPGWQFTAYRAFYAGLLALAAAGLALAWRRPAAGQADGVVLALLFLATISVGQAFFYIDGRHRLAVEPLLAVFSGRALAALAGWRRAGAARAPSAPAPGGPPAV